MNTFKTLKKEIDEHYDDDARCELVCHEGTLYFMYSDHHNGELFFVTAPDKPQTYQEVELTRAKPHPECLNLSYEEYGGIPQVIIAAFRALGGILLGRYEDA